jgi:DNA mismatch endonuclease, patch repair protein
MADVFDLVQRSALMRKIRSRGNRTTEQTLVGIFRTNHVVGWRRHFSIKGRPDFYFPKLRVAIFVDGCFWHACPVHCRMPATNASAWRAKLLSNRQRDLRISGVLRGRGIRVVRIWEHDLRKTAQRKTWARLESVLIGSSISRPRCSSDGR